MVKDFIETEREARNMMIAWIVLYVVAIVMLFVSGGGIAEHASAEVPILSPESFIKIDSILFFMTLVAMVFFPGPLFVVDSSSRTS